MSLKGNEVITPSAADTAVARESSRTLAPHVEDGNGPLLLQVRGATGLDELVLPPAAARLLLGILRELGRGNAVTVAPVQAELTTDQAADLLNVSRPHVAKLLDEGALPSRKVGSHRRVLLQDVLAYKEAMFAKRHAALEELSALDQELGLV